MDETTHQSEPEIDFERLRLREKEEVVRWFDSFADPVYGFIFYRVGRNADLAGDVARAWSARSSEGKPSVGVLLTEDGALKPARLTKSHVGEFVAVMIDGRVASAPKIIGEITGGRAGIPGKFTEDQAKLLAKGITER
jgi:preprotein translocase subunit SecD